MKEKRTVIAISYKKLVGNTFKSSRLHIISFSVLRQFSHYKGRYK